MGGIWAKIQDEKRLGMENAGLCSLLDVQKLGMRTSRNPLLLAGGPDATATKSSS
jgi:hypothetical protein